MIVPTTIADIERMIKDQVQENIHLDYKDSRALSRRNQLEVAKDVSAFANSDGGVLIYGVQEHQHLPTVIDEGVEDSEIRREWVEDALLNHITPRLDEVRVLAIPRAEGRSLYVIKVGKSLRGPHQSSDKKYYKRHNFKSEAMEDYEISDVRSRSRHVPSLISFELNSSRKYAVFDLANLGDVPAEDVKLEFSPEIPWPGRGTVPHPLKNGIRRLAPRKCIRFRFFPFWQLYSPQSHIPLSFTVRVSYFHPGANARLSEELPIDLDALRDSVDVVTEIEQQIADVVDALENISQKLAQIEATLTPLKRFAGSTGLKLSAPTLRNIKRLLKEGSGPEPVNPVGKLPSELREILDVDEAIATSLYEIFTHNSPTKVEDIPGITHDLLQRIRSRLDTRDQP